MGVLAAHERLGVPSLAVPVQRARVRRPGPLPFAGLAGAVGLSLLGGHPASSYQVLAVLVCSGSGFLASRSLRDRLVPRLGTFALALLVGTALAAVALIPFAELLAHSSDATARAEASDLLHQPSRYLLGIFLPDYWGHAATSLQFGTGLEERAYYMAALPLMLGRRRWPSARPRANRRLAVGAAALAVSTGLWPLYDLVGPAARIRRDQQRALRGDHGAVLRRARRLGSRRPDRRGAPSRRRAAVLGLAGLLALPVVIAVADHKFGFGALGQALQGGVGLEDASPDAAAVIKLASVLEWVGFARGGARPGVPAVRGRLGPTAFVALASLLVVLDLFKAGMGYNPAIPENHAEQPATPAIRFLQARRPARFAALEVKTPISLAYPLPPNVAMRYRLYDVRGYVIPTEERYFELWRRARAPSPDCYYLFCTQAAPARPRAFRALGLLGVSYLLQHPHDPLLPGRPPAYAGPDARLYLNPDRLPRAFLVGRQEVVGGGDEALARVTSAGFPARALAVTERPIQGIAQGQGRGSPGRPDRGLPARAGGGGHGRPPPGAARAHRQLVPRLEGDGRR